MWKNLLFYGKFLQRRALLINMGPQFDVFHANFGTPSSIEQFLGKIKSEYLKHSKKGAQQKRGPGLAGLLV